MRYPVKLAPAPEGGFVVTFPDIPEAITQGDSKEQALEMALDALITSLDFYFEDDCPVPAPSPADPSGDFIELPPVVVQRVQEGNAKAALR